MQHFVARALRAALVVSLRGASALFTLTALIVGFWAQVLSAQSPAPGPNSDPTYQALRNITLSGEAVSVSNVELKRDAGTFHLRSGNICFVSAVNGKVTGAVFQGDGNFVLTPDDQSERSMLKLLTKENEFSENFSQMVLRFTDSSYDELKKPGPPGAHASPDR